VPGYVRCPKCHRPLRRRPAPVTGGTSLEPTRRLPLLPIASAAVVAIAVVAYLGLRDDAPSTAPTPVAEPEQAEDDPAVTGQPAEAPGPGPPPGPDPHQVAAALEQTLKRQRLGSTVRVIGDGVDVRSGACEDPAMAAALGDAAPALKAAGLTEVRCLEQS